MSFHITQDNDNLNSRFDENLHATTETKHYNKMSIGYEEMITKAPTQMQSALFLNVIVRKSSTVLQLFTSEDQSLLVRGDTGKQLISR